MPKPGTLLVPLVWAVMSDDRCQSNQGSLDFVLESPNISARARLDRVCEQMKFRLPKKEI